MDFHWIIYGGGRLMFDGIGNDVVIKRKCIYKWLIFHPALWVIKLSVLIFVKEVLWFGCLANTSATWIWVEDAKKGVLSFLQRALKTCVFLCLSIVRAIPRCSWRIPLRFRASTPRYINKKSATIAATKEWTNSTQDKSLGTEPTGSLSQLRQLDATRPVDSALYPTAKEWVESELWRNPVGSWLFREAQTLLEL